MHAGLAGRVPQTRPLPLPPLLPLRVPRSRLADVMSRFPEIIKDERDVPWGERLALFAVFCVAERCHELRSSLDGFG